MIEPCVYLIKFSNGAWKVGQTGSIRTRFNSLKKETKLLGVYSNQVLTSELKYVFKTDNPIQLETRLLDRMQKFARFNGEEYFYASEEAIQSIIDDMKLVSCDVVDAIGKTRLINVMISDKSFKIVRDYQEEHKIKTRDEALDTLLLHFEGIRKES